MSNKKNVPVADKTVAGKNNYKRKKQAEKDARRVLEEKERKRKQREKRSEEIRKQRQKVSAKNNRIAEKAEKKKRSKEHRKNRRDNFRTKFKYYTSKEFLGSFNYFRIFTFIILPIALIVTGIVCISHSVFVNVPTDIRKTEFNGRLESETVAQESAFNAQQQQVFMDALKARGSRSFDFYFNSVVDVDDDFSTDDLCFGNPESNDCVLIATIYDGDTVLYRSLGLEPGREINRAKLFGELSYGVHDVKVAVNAYDKNTNEKVGTKYAEIKLAVGVDYNGEKKEK
ncbi:MAG TPA: hypothetical protein DCY31_01480 [Ruminococcaceae bacterium]|nr:hypothetical protein [Oscillospiraceae bacterium]